MKSILESLAQYRHYLILLVALLLANHVIMPLSEWQEEQQQTLSLMTKRSDKANSLLASEGDFNLRQKELNDQLAEMKKFVFEEPDESKFKLSAQASIESILNGAACDIKRIDFKGRNNISDDLVSWRVELRFEGDILCLTKATREIESNLPSMSISDFNVNHRGLTSDVSGQFNSVVNLTLWHLIGGIE